MTPATRSRTDFFLRSRVSCRPPPFTLEAMFDLIEGGTGEQSGIELPALEVLAVRAADVTWRLSYRSHHYLESTGTLPSLTGRWPSRPDPLVPRLGVLRHRHLPTQPSLVLQRPPRPRRRLAPGVDLRPRRDGEAPPSRRIPGGTPIVTFTEAPVALHAASSLRGGHIKILLPGADGEGPTEGR